LPNSGGATRCGREDGHRERLLNITEALEARVNDLIARDIDEIVSWANGKTFLQGRKEQTLSLEGYRL
jgi:membrane-bound ClpP family serine protease